MPGARRSRLQPHLRRPRVDGAILANAVRSALAGGWEPMKRGKPIAFAVDASGLPDVNQAP
jgi:hypothetical protein